MTATAITSAAFCVRYRWMTPRATRTGLSTIAFPSVSPRPNTEATISLLHVRQTVGLLYGRMEIKPPKSESSRRLIPIQPEIVAALREHQARQAERRSQPHVEWHDHDLVFAAANGNPT